MPERTRLTLDKVVRLKRGFDLPEPFRRPGSYPVIGSAGISGWHDQGPIAGPGVTIGRSGSSIGVATYYPGRFWPLNTTLFVEDFLGNDPRFVYYLLRQLDFRGFDSGSAQPSLNRNYIASISISLPDVLEQKAISVLIGALDDKIAVNGRIAHTSCELALSLFSEERWSARTSLSSLCKLRKVQVMPSTLNVPAVAHHSLPAFDNGQVPDICSPEKILSAKFLVDEPGVLLSKLNPDIPRVWRVEPKLGVPALASTEFLVLVPSPTINTAELWAVARQDGFLSRLAARVTGTSKSHQRVRPDDVLASDVVDPRATNGVTRRQVSSLVERAEQAREEGIVLAQLREVLLPKLISGELRVKDAERLVSDAA